MTEDVYDIPPIFSETLSSQEYNGVYHTQKMARINPDHTMLVEISQTAVTNAGSLYPVIGTTASDPCTTMIVYNTSRKKKIAALAHDAAPTPESFRALLAKVKQAPGELVEVHLIGGSKYAATEDMAETYHADNQDHINKYAALLKEIKSTPDMALRTFDVYDKPKPSATAIDARDGKLIRGSRSYCMYQECTNIRDSFGHWNNASEGTGFDGTTADMQRARSR